MVLAVPMIRLRSLTAVPLTLLTALSCSSPSAPHGAITLNVSNGTCSLGRCGAQQVLAFPGNQPHTPGGFWSLDLGTVTGSSLCVTIPAADTFRIIGTLSTGAVDTALVVWTGAMPVSLGVQDIAGDRFMATPTTSGFVPDQAGGWSIRLPQDTVAQPAQACTP